MIVTNIGQTSPPFGMFKIFINFMSVISDLQSWPRSGTEVHFTDARRVQPHSEMTTVETVFMGASEINVQKHLSPLLYKSHFLNSDRHKFLSELNAGSPG